MQPPYDITNTILCLVASVAEKIGRIDAIHLDRPPLKLRKRNRIRTIQASLQIEGNTLTEEQITALMVDWILFFMPMRTKLILALNIDHLSRILAVFVLRDTLRTAMKKLREQTINQYASIQSI